MSITPFVFDPATGWEDSSVFPTTRDNEELVRADLQRLHTQTRNYINNTLAPQVESALADQKTELEAEIAEISQGAVPDNTITAAKLTADSVTTPKIEDGAVTTPKIADEAVTKAKLSETLATEIDGKLDAPVGTIIQSTRTDLGDKWALCNGDLYDPEDYPELYSLISTNVYPKPNPYASGLGAPWGLYNGDLCAQAGTRYYVILAANGELKYDFQVDDTTMAWSDPFKIEHNGLHYVLFVSRSTTSYDTDDVCDVYETDDFTALTLVKTVSMAYVSNAAATPQARASFDGTYYYVLANDRWSSATATHVYVLDSSYNVVYSTETSSGYRNLVMCGGTAYDASCPSGNTLYITPQSGGQYRGGSAQAQWSVSSFSGSQTYVRMLPFNTAYNVLRSSGSELVFVPTNPSATAGQPPLKRYSVTGSVACAFVADNGRLYVYSYSNDVLYCRSIATSAADPSDSTAWRTETPIDASYSHFYAKFSGGASSSWRWSGQGRAYPVGSYVVNVPLLPTIAEPERYHYIKVEE